MRTVVPDRLRREVAEFVAFLTANRWKSPEEYEVVEKRFDCMKFASQEVEAECGYAAEELQSMQTWFQEETDAALCPSRLIRRVRKWPEGYPGDYVTLEAVYENRPAGVGIAALLDQYFLNRTLAVAIRSRLRKLADMLQCRAEAEGPGANWLNLACGSCRELLRLDVAPNGRKIHCVDTDKNALGYAANLLSGHDVGELYFLDENAFRFIHADRNVKKFGEFSTIYSAGLFDYIPDDRLIRLIEGLYQSLTPGGVLISPFKDCRRYETFDYHWAAKWHYFFQRTEEDYERLLLSAGIPRDAMRMERDDSGVILFYALTR